jgi:hypothetical protein
MYIMPGEQHLVRYSFLIGKIYQRCNLSEDVIFEQRKCRKCHSTSADVLFIIGFIQG